MVLRPAAIGALGVGGMGWVNVGGKRGGVGAPPPPPPGSFANI